MQPHRVSPNPSASLVTGRAAPGKIAPATRAEVRERPRGEPVPLATEFSPLCVIVDDDVSICSAFQHYLDDRGWLVQVAASAEQGLELLDDLRFLGRPVELLLLDISLPGIDGIRAVDLYRRLLHLEATVIVMSAYYGPEVLEELRAHDVRLFLEKPVDLTRFEQLLEGLPNRPRRSHSQENPES
ncbi:MAG: response regulator [Planctomycetota bacterium]